VIEGDEPRWLAKHPRRAYIVQLLCATPPWTSLAEIRRIDRRARELSTQTSRPHVVDHVIPITHKRVCGLNVPANLAIVPKEINARKSNHWCEWHGELFAEPEQFSLWLVGYASQG
jgi:hypothetical protein